MDFVERILPEIDAYFSLVIATNNDQITPLHYDENQEYGEKQIFDRLLANKFLLRLFVENYDGTMGSSMIEGIPIGLDLHSPFVHPLRSWTKIGEFGSPSVIDDTIRRLTAQSKPIEERKMMIYIDSAISSPPQYLKEWKERFGDHWQRSLDRFTETQRSAKSDEILTLYKGKDHWRRYWYRSWFIEEIEHYLDPETRTLFYLDKERYSQHQLFVERSKFVFTVSPFGNGLDCHRLWEALIFSHIVIVQSSPMDAMFEAHDLPVVVVQNFEEINAEMLRKWYEQYRDRVYANNATTRYKTTNMYWAKYIKQKTLHLLQQKRELITE